MAYSIGFDIFAKDRASETFDKFGKKVGQTETKFSKFSKAAVAGGLLAGAALIKLGGDAVSSASDVAESTSKVGVVFGDQAKQIMDASQTSATAMGISKGAYLEAAGGLGNLLVSLKVQPKAAADMSQQMVKLAGDMASFNNVPVADALAAIKSGLTGETEPLKAFGINMNDATLKNEAMKLGLIKTTKDAMDPQTKALAAQSLIMAQSTTAQGDFTRTQDGLANQTKIAAARLEDMQATVGTRLVPVMTSAVAIGLKMLDWTEKNSGTVKVLAIGIGALVAAVGTIVAITRTYTAVQTALNVVMAMNPIGLVVIAVGLLVAGIVLIATKTTWFQTAWQAMTDALGKAWQWLWNTILAPVIRFVLNGFASITDGIAKMLGVLGNIPGFEWAKTAADKMSGAAEKARALANGIKDIPDHKNVTITIAEVYTGGRSAAKGLGGSGGMVAGNAMGTDNWRGGPTWVGERGPEILNLPKGSQVIPNDRISAMADNGNGDVVSALKVLGDRISEISDRQTRTAQTMQRKYV